MTILETERLLFRPLTFEDVDDLTALYSDPQVMRFFDGVRTREQALRQIQHCQEQYRRFGFHFWATLHKPDNRFIGRCGLLPQVIEGQQEYEVAYMLARPYWGQGLGTEAACAIKEYAFREHGFPRVVSIIAPDNHASIRVAEKNGMQYVKDLLFEGFPARLYAVERDPYHPDGT